jgi:ABC-type nitrate/sulfonate/bicarbonate transport system substrate-binding protein
MSVRARLFFVVKDQRLFEEQGIDVDVVQVRSGPVAISAMAAGEAEFYGISATWASLGAMAAGLDLAFDLGLINKLDADFLLSSKIRTPDNLKGKSLGFNASAERRQVFYRIVSHHVVFCRDVVYCIEHFCTG